MIIGSMTVRLYAPWVHSLKEKRMIVKSLIAKLRSQFNISIAEIAEMDVHQTIVLGICCMSNSVRHADDILNTVLTGLEAQTEAEVVAVEREIG